MAKRKSRKNPLDERDGEGCTALHRAIDDEDAAEVARLLDAGADPDILSEHVSAWEDAYAPLHLAARRGEKKIVERLVEGGASLDLPSGDHRTTPLLLALMERQDAIVTVLLDAGADPRPATDDPDHAGWTALHFTPYVKLAGLAERLLDGGALVDAVARNGTTTLHHAVRQGRRKLVELLLARGAKTEVKDKSGETPMIAASSAAIRKLLEGAGAKPLPKGAAKARKLGRELAELLRKPDEAAALALLDAGADVTVPGAYGGSMLGQASTARLAERMIAAGLDPKPPSDALHMASTYPEAVRVMLAHGADPNFAHPTHGTPLGRCIRFVSTVGGHIAEPSARTVEVLLEHGADPDLEDEWIGKPIRRAFELYTVGQSWFGPIVEALVKAGADREPALVIVDRVAPADPVRRLLET